MNNMKQLLVSFESKLKIQRYATSTVSTYLNCAKKFIQFAQNKELDMVDEKFVEGFILHLVGTENISDSYQKQMLGSIGLLFKLCFNKSLNLKYLYPKRHKLQVPKYINQNEVKRLIKSINNIKHLCIVKLLYGGGLRLNEVLCLKVKDIDSNSMVIHVRQSKGRKDRTVMLPENILLELRSYYQTYKPNDYLFEGTNGNKYSSTSVQNIVKKAARMASINV